MTKFGRPWPPLLLHIIYFGKIQFSFIYFYHFNSIEFALHSKIHRKSITFYPIIKWYILEFSKSKHQRHVPKILWALPSKTTSSTWMVHTHNNSVSVLHSEFSRTISFERTKVSSLSSTFSLCDFTESILVVKHLHNDDVVLHCEKRLVSLFHARSQNWINNSDHAISRVAQPTLVALNSAIQCKINKIQLAVVYNH